MIPSIFEQTKQFISPLYLVGGSVRDIIRGVPPHDYDFTTPLLPDDIEDRIKKAGKHVYAIGKKFGTLGCKVDGQMVEITTFRAEKYDPNNRKPSVEYVTDIVQDLSRRDFTINAMAMDSSKNLIDPFEGQKDIRNKIIRCVGNPTLRFKDDPLRILRAIRFACQLDFMIEPKTVNSMRKLNYKLLNISRERWVMELDKILISQAAGAGISAMAFLGILGFIIPELQLQYEYNQNSKYHSMTLLNHTVSVLNAVPCEINMRWAALLHDIGKPFVRSEKNGHSHYIFHEKVGAEIVDKIANYLRWSNDRTKIVRDLVRNHMEENSPLKPYDREAH